MNPDEQDADSLLTDDMLADIYERAERQDDEMLESICPAYIALNQCDERYRRDALLGQGGLKDVFRAYDHRSRRWVAMARLREDRGLQFYDLFVREAWLVAMMSHPNIIKVHDTGVDSEGVPYFTMDLKGNTSLQDLILADDPPPRTELLQIFQKVCDAVAYAHSRGVIHLDLKPENIQCDRFGEVLVCDWGLAQVLEKGETVEDAELLKMAAPADGMGPVRGSSGYMAPEQILADQPKDERTDIYALGCILHTILCGEPPFTGSIDEVFEKTVHKDIAPLRASFPARRISKSLEAVVLKAAARDAAFRYESVMQLRQEIKIFLDGYSTEAEESGFFKEAHLFLRRNRMASLIAILAVVMLSASSALFIQRLNRQAMVTEEERSRANQLMTKVNAISSEYDLLTAESDLTKKQLADRLALAARSLINVGIYDRPLGAEAEARPLLDMALQLDPESGIGRRMQFYLHCLTLNYEEALKDPQNYPTYLELARAFPSYSFSETNRPSRAAFTEIFTFAQTASEELNPGYLERVFCYHAAALKGNHEDLALPLEALLSALNGGPEHFSMKYDQETAVAAIDSDQASLFLRVLQGRRGRSLLRFIPIKSLKVKTAGELALSEIDHLSIEMLDLSECSSVRLARKHTQLQLKRILIRRGSVDPAELRARIQTIEPLEIIEVD
ncbi:serine/threonine-protein kinase [Pontiella agarivorans]|uniref:Serine/threonine-protein kinase n=1 Tax=Pontiella agarivorans TaxID=3038953 RepID=A0ABU5MUL0_9BACT|nr:serine/threonine-protein kinase [Pontiella agarivorans]MDZ8117823.1 serine/threonine-protein kinase [Pontiella agarivorans]